MIACIICNFLMLFTTGPNNNILTDTAHRLKPEGSHVTVNNVFKFLKKISSV